LRPFVVSILITHYLLYNIKEFTTTKNIATHEM